ncbi:muconolactone Delta-isomerase family protein, partial [Actinoplanes sp. NPDC048791]|uniref:muconolactone Delta-isomerase family protein n=1 Tax=Actinoplanes sp. NPDC048791 TaxID=3154623 RepID=UPI0033E894BD
AQNAPAAPEDLEATLATMPLRAWRVDEVTPLSPHPNDPGRAATDPAGAVTVP